MILHQVVASHEGQEALYPLVQLGGRWRQPFLRLLCAAALPPAVAGDDRAPRLAARAEHLLTTTMAAVANAPCSLGTFHLSNVLAYSGRGPKEALASLVGEVAARVPGRYGPPSPRSFVALEDLEEFRHSHQGHLEALRAEVRTLQARCARSGSRSARALAPTRPEDTGAGPPRF